MAPYVAFTSAVGKSGAGESSCQVSADATLTGSTQTALVLAELAAEHGDKTFFADETLSQLHVVPKGCTSANALRATLSDKCTAGNDKTEKTMTAGNEVLSSDGFCLQSAEDEVIYIKLHFTN